MWKRLRITSGLWLVVALVISTWSKGHSPILDFKLPTGFGSFAFYSPDGETIMAFSEQPESGMVALDFWSAADGHKIRSAILYESRIADRTLSLDRQFLVTRHSDGFIRVTDLRSETIVMQTEIPRVDWWTYKWIRDADGNDIKRWFRPHWRVDDIAFSSQGNVIAAISSDGVIIWDATTGEPVRQFSNDTSVIIYSEIALSPDGEQLAFAGSNGWRNHGKLCYMKVKSDKVPQCVSLSTGIFDLAWSPDGQYIAMGTIHGVKIWNVTRRVVVNELITAGFFVIGEIDSLSFSPDGRFLMATGAETYWVALWDTHNWRRVTQFGYCGTAPCGYYRIDYSPTGHSVLIHGGDRWEYFTEQWSLPGFFQSEPTR
ncbi:MAG: WD40 repeat domain-containing protein [Anaerolineaceae bacterium]|nr:WD40 repeat domain-containing protein [Anaerolineaceae bacterium]